MNCKNCETPLQGNFCHDCGQKVMQERLTVKFLIQTFLKTITNVEKGFWHTTHKVLTTPHVVISDYWKGKTVPYYPPIRFLLIWATFSVLVNLWLGAFEVQQQDIQEMMGANPSDKAAAFQESINQKMKQYMNLMVFLQLPFYGYLSYRFFKKQDANYAEHLVANTFVLSITSILSIITLLILNFIPNGLHYFMTVGIFMFPVFYTLTFKKLFDIGWFQAFWKSILTFVFGMLFFIIVFSLVFGIGILIAVLGFGYQPG